MFQPTINKKKILYFCIISLSLAAFLFKPYAAGTMREMTSMQIVQDMKIGWNLGNTLDAWANGTTGLNSETCWGNPKTTKAMIDAVKAKGFKTLRLPVTWNNHFGSAPDFTIDKAWMDRVEEVVNYALNDGMYVILNTHHDEWVTLTSATQTAVTDKITRIWAQIAARFKDYSDYLIFETLNEPRLYGTQYEWSGGNDEARRVLNAYNLAIVNTIRNSGGNNALRHIMIPTHAATPMAVAQDALVIPNNDPRIIISQHTYWPYNFTMNTDAASGATASWGSASDKKACDDELDRIQNKFIKKGIPVVIGEWGAIDKSNTSARAVHAEYYANAVRKRGMLSVYWDNGYEKSGGFALLSRSSCTWVFPTIADGLIKGVNDVPTATQKNISSAVVRHLDFSKGIIRYDLPKSASVSLSVFNIQGCKIFETVNMLQTAGKHEVKLPNPVSKGSFVVKLKMDHESLIKTICKN